MEKGEGNNNKLITINNLLVLLLVNREIVWGSKVCFLEDVKHWIRGVPGT